MDQLIPITGLGCSEQMAGFVASYGVKNNLCRSDREKSMNHNSAEGGLITLCLWGNLAAISNTILHQFYKSVYCSNIRNDIAPILDTILGQFCPNKFCYVGGGLSICHSLEDQSFRHTSEGVTMAIYIYILHVSV